MAKQYHISLDDELASFVETQRTAGRKAREVFVVALEAYRADQQRKALENLLERGYRESAAEDRDLLREFEGVDHEAEGLLDETEGEPRAERKRPSGPSGSRRGKRTGKHAPLRGRLQRNQ